MGQVVWTEPALDDLREIVDFIAKRSPTAAAKLGGRLVRAPRRLARFPGSGTRVPEFDLNHIRELWVDPYRIIYAMRGEDCYIAAVVHGRRDLSSLLDPADLD